MNSSRLYPKSDVADNEDFLQEFVLNYNCGFYIMHKLFQLSKKLVDHLKGIFPAKNITKYLTFFSVICYFQ